MINRYLLLALGILSCGMARPAQAAVVEFDFARFAEGSAFTEQHPNWVRNNSTVKDRIVRDPESGKLCLQLEAESGGIRTRRNLSAVDGEASVLAEFCVRSGGVSFSFFSNAETEAGRFSAVRFDVKEDGQFAVLSRGQSKTLGQLELGKWYRVVMSLRYGSSAVSATFKVWALGQETPLLEVRDVAMGPSEKWPLPERIAGASLMTTGTQGASEVWVQRLVILPTAALEETQL